MRKKLHLPKLVKTWQLLCLPLFLLLVTAGCAGSSPRNDTGDASRAGPASSAATKSGSAATAAKDQNACHLLTQDEVSTLVEEKIVMRDQTEAGDNWSTCDWQTEKGVTLFTLTVYWANGKEEWDTWRAAQGLGSEIVKQAEGISPDNVVKQGPVAGIGDGAYFSGLLPSLVLKGDVLFEMNMFFVPKAETKFAGLARKLLAKIE